MGRLSAFCISGQTWKSSAGLPSPRACMIKDRVTLRVDDQRLRRRWNPKDSNPKRGNDSARGSLPRRELSTGLRDGGGNCWKRRRPNLNSQLSNLSFSPQAGPQISTLKSQFCFFSICLQKPTFRQKCWIFISFLIFILPFPYRALSEPLHFFRIMELRTTTKEVMNDIHRESTVKVWCFPREGAEV